MRTLSILLAVLVSALAACKAPGGVAVTLDEYTLSAAPGSEPTGNVVFTVRNAGAIPHQFVVVRSRHAYDRLPVRRGAVPFGRDGIESLAEISAFAPGESEVLAVDLDPGAYALICNVVGHYENGMRAALRVTG